MHENLFHCFSSATHYDETDHIVNDFHIIDLVPTRINIFLDWATYVNKLKRTKDIKLMTKLATKNLNSITQIVNNWLRGSGGGGVLEISLAGEVRSGPSYPDPV